MSEEMKSEMQEHAPKALRIAVGIFYVVIVLICNAIFLCGYKSVYNTDTGGGFLSPHDGVWFCHIFLSIAFAFAAVVFGFVLRGYFQRHVSIWKLLIPAVLLPMFLYGFNYLSFHKNGPLHFMVDEGGIFHFIVIGDYNFDGMNDEEYHRLYEEREYRTGAYSSLDDSLVDYIGTVAIGTGAGLHGCHCSYDWEDKVILWFLNKEDSVRLKQIEITATFRDPSLANDVSFCLDRSELNYTVKKNGKVSIFFDADACLALQNRLSEESRYIPIKMVVNE